MSNKVFFSHQLPLDTEEKVKAIAVCLIQPNAEIKVDVSVLATGDQEVRNFLNVIDWLSVGDEKYQVVGNDDVILFDNGSKIVFAPFS